MIMKRIIMYFMGMLLVLSLAACTPTPMKQAEAAAQPSDEAPTGGASDKVPDPNVEPMEIVSVYSPNEDVNGLTQAMDAVDELTAQSLVDKLVEYGVLEEGCEVLKFDMTNSAAVLDLSEIPDGDDAATALLLVAIGNTFTENFELDKLKILVNGESVKDNVEYVRDYKKIV